MFEQVIPPFQIGELEVPGSLVGSSEASVKAARWSETTTKVWVEPITGQIVNGEQKQHQYLAGADGTTEALTIIEAAFKGDPADVAATVASAGKAASLLTTLGSTVPLVAGILGIIGLIVGFVLARGARRTDDDTEAYAPAAPGAGGVDLSKS
jgi:hypothetical protein